LKLIENLRKDHDKSSKAAKDLCVNNADLAKILSAKDQKIQDLERALAERDEASRQEVTEIMTKLKLLFEEYKNALRDFGVRPAPFPVNEVISDFID
jgi:molecular chaperone GrpE (heat shock protein)